MFKILNQVKKSNEAIKNKQQKINKKTKEFEQKWDYLNKKNLSAGKKLP